MCLRGAFIFDLDNTLCDCMPRVKKYIDGSDKDLDAFYEHVEEDAEIFDVTTVMSALADKGFDILFVSGRRESCRARTLQWLEEHGYGRLAKSEHLFLRMPEDGHRADYVSKVRNYRKNIEGKWHVVGVFEDRDECVRAWRDLGLTCFQVADGDY